MCLDEGDYDYGEEEDSSSLASDDTLEQVEEESVVG